MAVFPFFRLPRELRDRIYKEAGGEDVKIKFECRPRVIDDDSQVHEAQVVLGAEIFHAPVSDYLLVSRQFKHEYERETRHHVILRIVTPTEEDVPTLVLTTDSKAHRLFRFIPELEIRLWKYEVRRQIEDYQHVGRLLMGFLDSLKTITEHFLFPIDFVDLDSDRPQADYLFASTALQLPNRSRTILLKSRIFVRSPFVSITKNYRPTTTDLKRYPHLFSRGWNWFRDMFQMLTANEIYYEVTPSSDEDALCGMKWFVFYAPSHFDMDLYMGYVEDILEN